MPPVVSLIGKANSGKTTLLEKLIPELRRRGYRVGTIKHHVHTFDMDKPGKDTWRHKKAGAEVVALSSPTGLGVICDRQEDTPIADLVARYFQEVDLVITEGYKQAGYPKLELFRTAAHPTPLPNRDHSWVALVSDAPATSALPQFAPDDPAGLAAFLIETFILPQPPPRPLTITVAGQTVALPPAAGRQITELLAQASGLPAAALTETDELTVTIRHGE